MKSFPMFVRTTGRRVVIVGGGEEAARKARLILRTDAEIVLAGPVEDAELMGLLASGRATAAPAEGATFRGAALAFVATGCAGADASLAALARAGGALVNVVDRPDLCDAFTPSIVDRDPLVVAIGTEGTAPVLGRQVRARIEAMLDPALGRWAAFAGRMRGAVARAVPHADRRAFWAWVAGGAPWEAFRLGREREAQAMVKAALTGEREARRGSIALVGAGPGARDLLTLRAVQRLQEADVILHDRLAGEEALELARRDARRICVGKVVGARDWPQERIDALMVAEARKGLSVVRLKSGDPSVFGRLTEELAAARAAGITVEVVPGVTAACAAAAAMGRSLTERGVSDHLVLATGAARDGDPDPDWAGLARPGATVALYMAVRAAPRIEASLLAAGVPPGAEIEVAASVGRPGQRLAAGRLAGLAGLIAAEGIEGDAVIFLRVPKLTRAVLAA